MEYQYCTFPALFLHLSLRDKTAVLLYELRSSPYMYFSGCQRAQYVCKLFAVCCLCTKKCVVFLTRYSWNCEFRFYTLHSFTVHVHCSVWCIEFYLASWIGHDGNILLYFDKRMHCIFWDWWLVDCKWYLLVRNQPFFQTTTPYVLSVSHAWSHVIHIFHACVRNSDMN